MKNSHFDKKIAGLLHSCRNEGTTEVLYFDFTVQ